MKKRATRAGRPIGWMLTDHACRYCGGRVLSSIDSLGQHLVRCAECGTELHGEVQDLCACGERLNNGKPAGFRCVRNAAKSASVPTEVVVIYEEGYRLGK